MIDEVHMLTNTAFNAMLKTLEEPPEYLKVRTGHDRPAKSAGYGALALPAVQPAPMAPETIREHLSRVLEVEQVPRRGAGALPACWRGPRAAPCATPESDRPGHRFWQRAMQEAAVRQMLGSVDRSYVFRLIEALARGDGKTVVDTAELLRQNGLSAASTLEEMAAVLARMGVLQALGGAGDADDSDPDAAQTAALAALLPADETQLLYSICLHGRADLGLAPDEYAALTMVLLRLLAFKPHGPSASAEKTLVDAQPVPRQEVPVATPPSSHAHCGAVGIYATRAALPVRETALLQRPSIRSMITR